MANYSLTVYVGTIRSKLETALSDLEAKLETVDNTKTIRVSGVAEVGPGKYFQSYAVYDT